MVLLYPVGIIYFSSSDQVLGGNFMQLVRSYSITSFVKGGRWITTAYVRHPNLSLSQLQQTLSCFDQLGDAYATYTVTIYVDLPIDTDQTKVFDPKSFYAGHCFVELSKSNPYGLVRKVFGWYPGSGIVAVSGIPTKGLITDDGGHEYQASYAITVSSAQFQSALQELESLYDRRYHISQFNCVDFVHRVFTAAGGSIPLPTRYPIHIVGNKTNDHTPNGLFEQIDSLQSVGVTGAKANHKKNFCLFGTGLCNELL